MNLSFEEKKIKIEQFWEKVLAECVDKNLPSSNFLKILDELKNSSLDRDILIIWIDLCVQSLQNETTPKFIKYSIFDALVQQTFWFQPETVQFSCIGEILKTFQILISINKNYLYVILKQMIENFKILNVPSNLQNFADLNFDFGNLKNINIEILQDLFEDRIKNLDYQLINSNKGFVKLEVFQKAKRRE